MNTRLIIAVSALVLLSACTTAAAPAPGERMLQIMCERGTLKICTAYAGGGGRLKPDEKNCSCN